MHLNVETCFVGAAVVIASLESTRPGVVASNLKLTAIPCFRDFKAAVVYNMPQFPPKSGKLQTSTSLLS